MYFNKKPQKPFSIASIEFTSIAFHLDHRSWVFLVFVYALSKSNSFYKGHTLKTRPFESYEYYKTQIWVICENVYVMKYNVNRYEIGS